MKMLNRHFGSGLASLDSDVQLMAEQMVVVLVTVVAEAMAVALVKIMLDFVAFEMANIADPFQINLFFFCF